MTNGDKIRAMTDEELAQWLIDCTACTIERFCAIHRECDACWLDWLKQEVQDEAD
ncbi:MAG: hypothetical protein J5482_02850 [Oscillospiraceae bacterium]|nr:hypothetical protein [Oscillospiraceae bacterium]